MMSTAFVYNWALISAILVAINLAVSGLFFLVLKHFFAKYKLSQKEVTTAEAFQQAWMSSVAILIFSTEYLLIQHFWGNHLKIYFDLDRYGLIYLPISYLLLVLATDFYFYLAHRLMHSLPRLRKYHGRHHQYTDNLSSWGGFAFHPIEAAILGGMLPFGLMLVPVHIYILYFYLITHLSINAYCHSGYSLLYMDRLDPHRLFNSAKRHYQHHQQEHQHLGLYTLFWEKLLPLKSLPRARHNQSS